MRRLEGLPLLIVATVRSTEPGTDPALLAEIAQDPMTERIQPGPLSPAAMPGLIERRLGAAPDVAFAAACHEATGGNPLLLDELLKGLAAEGIEPRGERAGVVRDLGPRAVSRAVLLRLARLGDEDVAVARALAVLGEGAELAELAALAGLDEPEVARATGELARVEILRREPPLGFVHPLVRDAVYDDLPPAQRELDQNRAARLLRDRGAAPERVAAHLLRVPAVGEDWVAELLIEAARAAAEKGAAENAVDYLGRALEEPLQPDQRATVVFDLGLREMDVRGDDAVAHLREAYELLTAPEDRAWAAYALARTLMFTRREIEAAEVAKRAREELGGGLPDFAQALEAIELETIFFGRPEVEELAAHRALPRRGRRRGAGSEDADLGDRLHLGELRRRRRPLRGARPGSARRRDAAGDRQRALLGDGDRRPHLRRSGGRPRHLERSAGDRPRRGSLFMVLTVNLWRGFDLLRRGDLGQAQESLESGLEDMVLWSGSEARMVIQWPAAFLAKVYTERGELEAAERVLDRGAPEPGQRGDGPNFWRQAKIELLLAQGRPEEALALCDDYEALGGHMMRNPAPAPWRTVRALVLDRLGRGEEGIELVREELEAARALGRRPADRPRPAGARHARARGGGRATCARRSPRWSARPPASSTPRRCSRSAPRCAWRASRPRRASRCAGRWRSPAPAAPRQRSSAPARSSPPPASAPAARRSAASSR